METIIGDSIGTVVRFRVAGLQVVGRLRDRV